MANTVINEERDRRGRAMCNVGFSPKRVIRGISAFGAVLPPERALTDVRFC